jgi:HlyD family secretion protein
MSAQVEIFTQTVNNVVAVPIAAVTTRKVEKDTVNGTEEKVREIVFVREGNTAREREITTGISDDKFIEVKSGLKAGEEIITGPYLAITKELKDGAEIEEKKADKGFQMKMGKPEEGTSNQ